MTNAKLNTEYRGDDQCKIAVAIYVRMSTEHQNYSIENQTHAILDYAINHNMTVTRTFSDYGISGLSIKGRKGLTSLLEAVESDTADFEAILVYDISRWGRFQDADESAYYEYCCKKKGIPVHYCAEQFDNDGSSFSTIVKNLKRAMAADYSRELSAKVFAGQCRLVKDGYRQGSSPGYGLRRMLIDENGNPKELLARGQYKYLHTDRVILVPGPQDEIDTILLIYNLFVKKHLRAFQIANLLNNNGLKTDLGNDWTKMSVTTILNNEKYIGNNVYNKSSTRLSSKRSYNHPDAWVIAENAFVPIVPISLFKKAQKTIILQRKVLSDEEMLERLKRVYKKHGTLTTKIIDKSKFLPKSNTYRSRFGSLTKVYSLVGHIPTDRKMPNEEMIEKLKVLYLKRGYLSTRIIDNCKELPSASLYNARFGSLLKAYEIIGFTPPDRKMSDEEMLKRLRKVYRKHGTLSCSIIDKSENVPSSQSYLVRFGKLLRAYELVGFKHGYTKLSETEMIVKLKELLNKHKHLSCEIINADATTPSLKTYKTHFGSLKNIYKLVGFQPNYYKYSDHDLLKKLKDAYKKYGYLTCKLIDGDKRLPKSETYRVRFGSLLKAYELVGYKYKSVDLHFLDNTQK